MPSFVYSPGIKVYIDSYKKGSIIDVSDDLTGAGMQRRADGVSQFQFGLTNARRKYDNVFTPNDRIVVVMKRLTWMRTFTGYLNSVPLLSSWPRDVGVTATCSLKRLQYFWWDPNITASQELVRQSLLLSPDGSAPDGGIKQAVINLLEEVVDWSGAQAAHDKALAGTKIHIGGIPKNWFDFAAKIAKSVADNVEQEHILAAQLLSAAGAGATLSGQSVTGKGTIDPSKVDLDAKQAAYADQILAVVFSQGLDAKDAALTIGCALQESTLRMYANRNIPASLVIPHDAVGGDHLSVGLFQQQAGPGFSWGTVAECMNVEHSTLKFLEVLKSIPNRKSMPFTAAIQAVQRSGKPSAYAKWEGPANKIVQAYLSSVPTLGGDSQFQSNSGALNSTGTSDSPNSVGNGNTSRSTIFSDSGNRTTTVTASHGTTTPDRLIQVAEQVTQRSIPYSQALRSNYDNPNPTYFDCSSFVRWVYYQSIGETFGMPGTAQTQYEWAISNGGKAITPQEAANIPGALMFVKRGQDHIHHVEMSLGDNQRTIGSHHSGTVAGIINYPASQFDLACTLPKVDYTGAVAGTSDGALLNGSSLSPAVQAALASTGATATGTDIKQNGSSLDSLFGSVPWTNAVTTDDGLANNLTGIRALQNDSPILPYISNLLNATMRQFCSAPNGDFIAWFPDYYGIWGTAAKMVLQPIEVSDFTVSWSDEYLVTHQFVVGSYAESGLEVNLASADISAINVINRLDSTGIATIEQPGIMAALFGLDQTPDEQFRFTKFIYDRFGPRPNFTQVAGAIGPKGEFFMALFKFMQNWANQYNANIDITWMPELYPGMLVQFPDYNFQAYVNTVEHSVAFGSGGSFSTRINISAPARIKDTGPEDRLYGLPIAGVGGKPLGGNTDNTPAKGARSSTPPTNKVNPAVNAKLERLP